MIIIIRPPYKGSLVSLNMLDRISFASVVVDPGGLYVRGYGDIQYFRSKRVRRHNSKASHDCVVLLIYSQGDRLLDFLPGQ